MEFWKQTPLLRILLLLIVGILFAPYLPIKIGSSKILLYFFFLLHILFLAVKKMKLFPWDSIPIYLFSFSWGIMLGVTPVKSISVDDVLDVKSYIEYRGYLLDNYDLGKYNRLSIQLVTKMSKHKPETTERKVFLHTSAVKAVGLHYGDEIIFRAKMRPIIAKNEPYNFDYNTFLLSKGFSYSGYLEKEDFKITGEKHGSRIKQYLGSINNKFSAILQNYMGFNREFEVANALVLGNKSTLSKSVKQLYQKTGAMHILAVSGLHVGIIFQIFLTLFNFIESKLNWGIKGKGIFLILVIWAYVLITGASTSVVRSGIMFSIFALGITLEKRGNTYNSLVIAALIILSIWPQQLFNVGFQLSFSAVVGIVYFYPILSKIVIIENKILKWFWSMFVVSLAAQISTLPISIYYFHSFPTYFWLSGVVAIPVATVAIFLSLFLFVIHSIPFLNMIIGKLLAFVLLINNSFLDWVESLPYGQINDLWITKFQVFMLIGSVFIFGFALVRKKSLPYVFVALMICGIVFLTTEARKKNSNLNLVKVFSSYPSTSSYVEIKHLNQMIYLNETKPKANNSWFPLGIVGEERYEPSCHQCFVESENLFGNEQFIILTLDDTKANYIQSLKTVQNEVIEALVIDQPINFSINYLKNIQVKVVVLSTNLKQSYRIAMAIRCNELDIIAIDLKTENYSFLF